jgi:hypothetical protein
MVREEKKAQRNQILDYLILTIGIIGAVTGLLAVILK